MIKFNRYDDVWLLLIWLVVFTTSVKMGIKLVFLPILITLATLSLLFIDWHLGKLKWYGFVEFFKYLKSFQHGFLKLVFVFFYFCVFIYLT